MRLPSILFVAAAIALVVGVFVAPGAEEAVAAGGVIYSSGESGASCFLEGPWSGSGSVTNNREDGFGCVGYIDGGDVRIKQVQFLSGVSSIGRDGSCSVVITPALGPVSGGTFGRWQASCQAATQEPPPEA